MSILSKYASTFKQEAITRNMRIRVLSTHLQQVPAIAMFVRVLLTCAISFRTMYKRQSKM
jgi:hypothetical protein